jgi:hypothetical protein
LVLAFSSNLLDERFMEFPEQVMVLELSELFAGSAFGWMI